jgi:aldose 1-epimerase
MTMEVTRLSRTSLTRRLRCASGEPLRLFPFHELSVEARLETRGLRIATKLVPIGRESIPVSFGSHPYLRILDETRSRWRIALGAPGRLLLDDAMIPTGEREAVAPRASPWRSGSSTTRSTPSTNLRRSKRRRANRSEG